MAVGLVHVHTIKPVIELLNTVNYSQAFDFYDNDPFTNIKCHKYLCNVHFRQISGIGIGIGQL